MANVTLTNRKQETSSIIGAIVCRTPKTLGEVVIDNVTYDGRCSLIKSVSDLIKYFGDPYISPSDYSELTLVYDLVRRGIPIYISSLYEMKDNNDGFEIPYNGYTEFVFLDDRGYDSIGYRLKSDIKFCQPIIQSDYDGINTLTVYVSPYILDRSKEHDTKVFDPSRLYKTYTYTINLLSDVTDQELIDALKEDGFELQIINKSTSSKTEFIDQLKKYSKINITLVDHKKLEDHSNHPNRVYYTYYYYDLNSNDYDYNLYNVDLITTAYYNSIESLHAAKVEPHYVCTGKLCKSTKIEYEDGFISFVEELDNDMYSSILNTLLSTFTEDSNTYLFINAPDASFSTVYDMLSLSGEYENSIPLLENYNCDLFYGYSYDYLRSSLNNVKMYKVFYPVSLMTLYNILITNSVYLTNSVSDLNISVGRIKSTFSEELATALIDYRCNSVVTFVTGSPSIYGDRSLSLLPNLRYSHISRSVVRIRRVIKEYIEGQKFTINTQYNMQSSMNHIRTRILDEFVSNGVLDSYTTSYDINDKNVNIYIYLSFNGIIENINLDFTI